MFIIVKTTKEKPDKALVCFKNELTDANKAFDEVKDNKSHTSLFKLTDEEIEAVFIGEKIKITELSSLVREKYYHKEEYISS